MENQVLTDDFERTKTYLSLLPYQREDIASDARFRWNCWARQTGKSFTKSLRRIVRGLMRRRNQIFLSAGERQSRELMEKVRQHCYALKITRDTRNDEYFQNLSIKQLEIQLPRGVRVIALPANPMTARGYTGDVFLDEFAMHGDDREIWAAMLPMLLRGAGELDIASTPHGKGNLFYELQQNDLFHHSTITLPEAIEQGLPANAEDMRRAMADDTLFRQEFLCEFLDEATAFLTFDQIDQCVDRALAPFTSVAPLMEETRELFVGVDVGRVRDLTVIWVLTKEDDAFITAALFELRAAPFREQFQLLSELMAVQQVRRCCIDAGGLGMQLGEELAERFGAHRVESLLFTAALKSQLAGGLKIAVESRRIRIPDDERIRRDWHSVERTVSESGHFRLAAPRREGSHADRFWAAALAIHAADAGAGKSEYMTGRRLYLFTV